MPRKKESRNRYEWLRAGLPSEQWDWLDSQPEGRQVVLRRAVDFYRQTITQTSQFSINFDEKCYVDATFFDLEWVFDVKKDDFLPALIAASQNGRDVSHLVPTYKGLLEKLLKKTANEEKIEIFLNSKMAEVII